MTCSGYNFSINAYISKKGSAFLCADDYCIIRVNRFISQFFISTKNIIRKMHIGILYVYYEKFNSLIHQFTHQTNMVRMIMRCQNISNIADFYLVLLNSPIKRRQCPCTVCVNQ